MEVAVPADRLDATLEVSSVALRARRFALGGFFSFFLDSGALRFFDGFSHGASGSAACCFSGLGAGRAAGGGRVKGVSCLAEVKAGKPSEA